MSVKPFANRLLQTIRRNPERLHSQGGSEPHLIAQMIETDFQKWRCKNLYGAIRDRDVPGKFISCTLGPLYVYKCEGKVFIYSAPLQSDISSRLVPWNEPEKVF